MNIPPDLVIISDLDISKLTQEDFTTIIYEDWFSVKSLRFGEVICISAEKSPIELSPLEDKGFSLKDTVSVVDSTDKRWNNYNFFIN